MPETLAVVALDAADYTLAQEWECDNLLLDEHGQLETFTHSFDHPFTPEVWTSVATGMHPDEHDVRDDAADWNSLPLQFASKVTQYLPHEWRNQLGKPFRDRGYEQEIHQTNASHAFENGAVLGWPGISEAEHLSEAWSWASKMSRDEMTTEELREQTLGNTGQEFGWLLAMDEIDVPIAGVHSHVLDITGHAFASREENLREYYERIDDMLGWVRENVDDLVVLSDHGMQVSWLDDDDPGAHSMRSMVAATEGVQGNLPDSVFEVRAWLEENTGPVTAAGSNEDVGMDTAEERLRELGYIN